ncbi:glycosyltransferase family 2 protein [Paraclostridium sordellii]|uniref:glycosyltransferase family 2 protein n=1 Tax=Paraclostridium sordellii TaxID=1505 RepID=UPI00096A5477|nr:glycosyltransferase family 2 protein [Paeniclostridium sordellii]
MRNSVCAIIVTYNRKTLLKKCIESLLKNSSDLDGIIIVNNASTDGTEIYLEDLEDYRIEILNLSKNIGGAGGFSRGIEYALNKDYDYFWIMDDDTIVNSRTLENLLKGFEGTNENIGFICSNVLFTDKSQCIMNIPRLSKNWGSSISRSLLKVDSASFVSILIKKEAIVNVGLPISEFFIWGDDLEYTERISKKYSCFMSINSTVVHEMKNNIGVNIVSDDINRIDRYYYEYRNKLYIYKKNKQLIKYFIYVLKSIIKILLKSEKYKMKRLKVIFKGSKDGIVFNPSVKSAG